MTHTISHPNEAKCYGNIMCSMASTLSNAAHWFPRIAIASVFIYHGIDKLPKIDMVAQMLSLSPKLVMIVALMEIVGGAMIIISPMITNFRIKDMLTRLGALILIPIIVSAIGMVHWGQWSFMASETHKMGGMEFQFTLLMILLFLFVRGKSA